MRHKNCGGEIEEDWDKIYEYEGMEIPAYYCQKCGQEILGGAAIEFDDEALKSFDIISE